MHSTFISYIFLLLIIAFLIMLAIRIRLPYPIVLVVGGLVLSFLPWVPHIQIDPDLIFIIFLPPLLYEAAWDTSWKEFWRWRRIIGSFAFLIVPITSCVVALVSNSLIPGFTLALGFLLGGIVSPPDAVSATAVMKTIKVPRRLQSIVEGESLLNDASSLIVFRFAMAAVITGQFVLKSAAFSFVLVIVMGILVGIAVGLVFYAIHRWLPTTTSIDTVLTLTTPYIMYFVAESFHFSGVLAVVAGGLFLSQKRHVMLTHRTRMRGLSVWSTLGFVLNGLIFMLIGLQLPIVVSQLGPISLRSAISYGLIISAALIVSRLLCAFGASLFTMVASKVITTADSRPGWRGPLIFGWTGMRGVVSLAAALSIPVMISEGQPFPQRNLILFITFTVILVTLVFQGLTLPTVIKWANMEDPDHPLPTDEQERRIRIKMLKAGLQRLDEKFSEDMVSDDMVKGLKNRLEYELKMISAEPDDGAPRPQGTGTAQRFSSIMLDLIAQERDLLEQVNKKKEVDEEVIRKQLAILDLEEEKIHRQFMAD